MTRFSKIILLIAAVSLMATAPAMAADPDVSKTVLTSEGDAVVILSVTARGRSVYGVTITDATESIDDIVAPNGWVGIASGDRVTFRTVDTPIASGGSLAFRLVTKNAQAGLSVTFRDAKSPFGSKKSL
jgi:F420-0:gamma-glutamyl ligase-like protein